MPVGTKCAEKMQSEKVQQTAISRINDARLIIIVINKVLFLKIKAPFLKYFSVEFFALA